MALNLTEAITSPVTTSNGDVSSMRAGIATIGGAVILVPISGGNGAILPASGGTGFTVLVNGVPPTVDSVVGSTALVTITLHTAIAPGDPVTLAYAPGNITDVEARTLDSFFQTLDNPL